MTFEQFKTKTIELFVTRHDESLADEQWYGEQTEQTIHDYWENGKTPEEWVEAVISSGF